VTDCRKFLAISLCLAVLVPAPTAWLFEVAPCAAAPVADFTMAETARVRAPGFVPVNAMPSPCISAKAR